MCLIIVNTCLIELNKEMWQTFDVYLGGLIIFVDYCSLVISQVLIHIFNQRRMIIKKKTSQIFCNTTSYNYLCLSILTIGK